VVAFNTIKAGDRLYDCHRYKMGNTTMSKMGCWDVVVIEVDAEKRRANVSWNGNAARWVPERYIRKLRRSKMKKAD
jgi:hypothetical protein